MEYSNNQCRWFYQENNDPKHIIWREYDMDISNALENHFVYKYHENIDNLKYHKLEIEIGGNTYIIDFPNYQQLSNKDLNSSRLITRFEGDPNINKDLLESKILAEKYRWYFSSQVENSREFNLTPYRIADNDEIEKNYINFLLSKKTGYKDNSIKIDYKTMEEINQMSGNKKVYRIKQSPKNMKRLDYSNNENEPIKIDNILLDQNSLSSLKKEFFLNFKNIFPNRYFSEVHTYTFYINYLSESIILHIKEGWLHHDINDKVGEDTTEKILNEIKTQKNYQKLCKFTINNGIINFEEISTVPVKILNRIFNKNWYFRYRQDNCFIWEQYVYPINSQIDHYYKYNYLFLGDKQDIEISSDLKINFEKNIEISEVNRSIMRFGVKNQIPDMIISIKVSENLFSALKSENEKKNNVPNKPIFYANRYGPSNITELIDEIKKELENESKKLNLEKEYTSLETTYLNYLNYKNFSSLIIKLYTEESFIYRSINKILIEKDTERLLRLKYFYFSLIYSLEKYKSVIPRKVLYKGIKLRNSQSLKVYDTLELNQMLLFKEFLSTTYDINLAQKNAELGEGSYLIEINIPQSMIVYCIEDYSRFVNEKEVILALGTILKFLKRENQKYITNLSFELINSKIVAYSALLSKMGRNIDLSKINFNLMELQLVFNSLNKHDNIQSITFKIYDALLIPYFAKYVSINEKIYEVTLIRENELINGLKIINHSFFDCTITRYSKFNLINFTFEEKKIFFKNIFNNEKTLKTFSLINSDKYYLNNQNSTEENRTLKKIVDDNILKEIQMNEILSCFINRLSSYNNLNKFLLELRIVDIIVQSNFINQICKFLKGSESIKIVELSSENCGIIKVISNIYETNKSIIDFKISFINIYKNTRRLEFSEYPAIFKKIVFKNIVDSSFSVFINDLLNYKRDIIFLKLSENNLTSDLFKSSFQFILSKLTHLEILDLSNNLLCDNIINDTIDILKNNNFLKKINLENNLINQYYINLLYEIPQLKFYLKHNLTEEKINHKTNFNMLYTLTGHTNYVRSLIVLSNGNIASSSSDKTIRIWDGNNNYSCLYVLMGHTNYIRFIIQLSNGNIASCSTDNTIRIWDKHNNFSCIHVLSGHESEVLSLVELSNGNIASCSSDKTLRIWDGNNNFSFSNILTGHESEVLLLVELSNGNIASCSLDKTIRIWDGNNNYSCFHVIMGHQSIVTSLIQIFNGNIASCSDDKTIRIWDIYNNYSCLHILKGHQSIVTSLIKLLNGNIASCSDDKTIRIWDVRNIYSCLHVLIGHESNVISLVELSNGNIASCSWDKTLRIWDAKNNYLSLQTLTGHESEVLSLVELSNGNIASCSFDKTIRIWDGNNNYSCPYILTSHTDNIRLIILLSNGNIASCSFDKTIRIWDGINNFSCIHVLIGHESYIISLIQLSNGNIASCSDDQTIRIWDEKNNYSCLFILTGHESIVMLLIELSNGNIASCSFDKTIRIWDSKNNYSCIYVLNGHDSIITSLIQLSNGNIASCSDNQTIRIWNSNNNYSCLHVLTGHVSEILSLIELNNKHIASCSWDKSIRIWDGNNNYSCLHVLIGHTDYVRLIIQLSNLNIASISWDKTIRIWDSKNNYSCIYVLNGHEGEVLSFVELSNGNIASCSDDKTIRIWDGNNNYSCLHVLTGHTGSINSLVELSNGNIISCSEDKTIRIWINFFIK